MDEKQFIPVSSIGAFHISTSSGWQVLTPSLPRFASLAALGVYQEGMAKNRIGDKPCQAHIYEYTTQLSIDPDLKFKGLEKGIVPVSWHFHLPKLE